MDVNSKLFEFINASPTAADYTELCEADEWRVVPGGKFFVRRNDSSIIARKFSQGRPVGRAFA